MLNQLTIRQEAERCLLCHEPPCSAACPIELNPAGRIRSLVFYNFARAAREPASFCLSCKACEKVCIRGKMDRPVEIASLMGALTGCRAEEGGNGYA